MIYTILYWLIVVPLFTLILIHVINGVFVYRSLEFYRKQGIHTEFYPLFGIFIGVVLGTIKKARGKTNNEMGEWASFFTRDYKEPFFVVGGSTYSGLGVVNVIVTDDKMVSKLYSAESKDNYSKVNAGGTMGYDDFVFMPCEEAMPRKALYTNLARTSSNILIFDAVKKIVVGEIKALKEELKLDAEGKVKAQINLRPFFFGLINKLLMYALFDGQQIETEDKVSFCKLSCDAFALWFQAAKSPLTHLLAGFLNCGFFEQSRLNPLSFKKDQRDKYEICMKLMHQALEERELRQEGTPDDQLGDNMLDNVIREQRRRDKAGEPRIPIKAITSDIIGICFGGNDTSMGFCVNGYDKYISQGLQDKFLGMMLEEYGDESKGKKVIRPDVTFDDLMSNAKYISWFKEMLRTSDVFTLNFERTFTKDIEINGYKFKKGHQWAQGTSAIHFNPKTNPKPQDINFDRFLEGKAPEGQNNYKAVTFGQGKRICLGYQIAEMFLKVIYMYFSSAFKLEKGSDYSDEIDVDIARIIKSLYVNVQCRPEFWENIDSY